MPVTRTLFDKNKKIGFVGLGVSNMPVAEMLMKRGYAVSLRDRKPAPAIEGYDCRFGDDYLKDIYEDVLFLAPVLRPDIPEILAAREAGVYVTSEMNEYLKQRRGRVIAVTGSDGKTTTTTLISEILKAAGFKVMLGGNIGINLLASIDSEDENTVTVCELSSFQLMKISHAPDVAVITNVSPNHLDWHKSMDEYIDAKKHIFSFMKSGYCVINADDAVSEDFAHEIPVPITRISGKRFLNDGVCFDSESIYVNGSPLIGYNDIIMPGRHNRYNYCEAIAATLPFTGMRPDIISGIAGTFPGVKHRCQFIRELDGVRYYDSTIDSSPTRTAACLGNFAGNIIVIAGGYDKKVPLDPLGPAFAAKTKAAVLMGHTGPKIHAFLDAYGYKGQITDVADMPSAVAAARSLAVPGDIVLLSPAASSFDLFKNFEERGEVFVSCVNALEQ